MAKYKCPYCGAEFDTFYSFMGHMMANHYKEIENEAVESVWGSQSQQSETSVNTNNNMNIQKEGEQQHQQQQEQTDPRIIIILPDDKKVEGRDWYEVLSNYFSALGLGDADPEALIPVFWEKLREQGLVKGTYAKKPRKFFERLKRYGLIKDIIIT